MLLRSCEKILKILQIKRKIPFKIFVGSQWFALTNGCVGYILEQIKNPKYENFFKYSLISDEAFFQTIIGNSEYYQKISVYLTYVDWIRKSPAKINQSHLEILKTRVEFNEPYGKKVPLFARKFDSSNAELLTEINSTLRKTLPKRLK